MKYLLQAIEAKRAAVKLGDAELRDLLTEVCKGRDEREEFLESIDRIITELKNYTEHSTAFLSKVSKRDAPDYYEVIKHPMDLGTMQKKVKAGQYKTKKQFAHDLGLIWDNCLLYNSDPTHPLRRNVQFMRKKADHLLEFISDKSDVKDALVMWGTNTTTLAGTDGANGKANGATGAAEVNGKLSAEEENKKRKRERERERTKGKLKSAAAKEGAFGDQEAFVRSSKNMVDWGKIDAGLELGLGQAGPSSRPMMAVVEAMDKIKADADDDPLSATLPSIFPTLMSSKGKGKATTEPVPSKITATTATAAASTADSTSSGTTPHSKGNFTPIDAAADWFTIAASHQLMTGALPALPSSKRIPATPNATELESRADGGRIRKKKPFHLVPATRRKGLQGRIARNVRTLHKVQETHSKFLSLAHYVENEAPIPAYLTSMSSDEESDYPSDVEDHTDDAGRFGSGNDGSRNPFTRLSADSAREHAAYNVRMLLAHQGFEGGHRVAVDVLTDALGEFLSNLGRMLRVYSDRYASSMSAEEIILHTLHESGTPDVHSMENYIKNDVERYGTKMTDLLRKLRSSYREQFNMSTERGVIEDEALFADNGEALVAGGFAEGLGDDYFGFRELGLDRELGMAGLTVPTRLFYGKSRAGGGGNAGAGGRAGVAKENVLPYPPPPEPIPLVAAAIGEQIGLLQGFYGEKIREHRQRVKHLQDLPPVPNKEDAQDAPNPDEEETKEKPDPVIVANTLPDQEQEKQRYKVPPTGKMPRRLMWSLALERKQVLDKLMERERLEKEKQAAAAGVGGVAMSTGGGGGGSGKGKEGKVKKNSAIAA